MYKGTKKYGKDCRHRKRVSKKEFNKKLLESNSKDSCVKSRNKVIFTKINEHKVLKETNDQNIVVIKFKNEDGFDFKWKVLKSNTDNNQNIICKKCNKILINNQGKILSEYLSNCCRKCKFSWYCRNCSTIYFDERFNCNKLKGCY